MLRDKPVSHLILILLTSMLGANIIGEVLRVLLTFVAGTDTDSPQSYMQSLGSATDTNSVFNTRVCSKFIFELLDFLAEDIPTGIEHTLHRSMNRFPV